MKWILIISPIILIGFATNKPKESFLKVYFLDQKVNYGIAPNKKAFWTLNEYRDSLLIKDKTIYKNVMRELNKLRDTTPGEMYFAYAFVSYRNNKPVDTFYADPKFRWWVVREKSFFLESEYFKNGIGKFR